MSLINENGWGYATESPDGTREDWVMEMLKYDPRDIPAEKEKRKDVKIVLHFYGRESFKPLRRPPDDGRRLAEEGEPLCSLFGCGGYAALKCGRCKARYCSALHQQVHWAIHRKECRKK
jgi:hypothetical protein